MGSNTMTDVRPEPLSDAELARLYEFVEGGYRRPSPVARLRRALARRLRRGRLSETEVLDRASAPDPIAAVYLRDAPTFWVPLSWCRSVSLFGFGPGAFDAWEATARQVLEDPGLPASETVLAQFVHRFVPRTAADRLFADPERDADPGSPLLTVPAAETLYFWPWSEEVRAWPESAPEGLRLRSHGPAGPEVVELEVWRLKRLVASVKERGYRPPQGDGIRGQLLGAHGDYRFLVRSGYHRVAVLSALGHADVPVRFAQGVQRLMTLDQLPTWPLVRQGVFSPREAELVVERLFTEDGRQMAARLGLVAHVRPEEGELLARMAG